MKLKMILFDLDGTLLPMDQDVFLKQYFKTLSRNLAIKGFDSEKLIKAIWSSTEAMLINDGKKSNEEVFWNKLAQIYGKDILNEKEKIDEYYESDFSLVKESCGFNIKANETIKYLKKQGYTLVLATNPVFPYIATKTRIGWAGLDIDDFDYITAYENSSYTKPNLKYYLEILNKFSINHENCLMIGNDVNEDMVCEKLDMKVFLMTDNLINKNNVDINKYPHGSFNELIDYIDIIKK